VQQVATPPEVYAQPANLDVARFMGYRNVVEFGVEREDGHHVVLARDGVRLIGTRKQPLSKHAFVAMRPEEIVVGERPDGVNTLAGRVDVVEYGGRDSLIDVVTADGTRLHVRTHVPVAVGDSVRLHVAPERALVYSG
jgi:putative spermidine/putrescine transport system ATP-binding protein